MRKVISFSLWGNDLRYLKGMEQNLCLADKIYQNWEVWIYYGRNTPSEFITSFASYRNCRLMKKDVIGDWNGMFWRFEPAWDASVDVMISRDCDSRLSFREKYAVDEWLSSGLGFHIMRDHPWHEIEILGGMWGCRKGVLAKAKDVFENYNKDNYWQVDQEFLAKEIYPLIKDNCMVHDSFFAFEAEIRPFPKSRKRLEFVGEAFDENGERNPEVVSKLRESLKRNYKLKNVFGNLW